MWCRIQIPRRPRHASCSPASCLARTWPRKRFPCFPSGISPGLWSQLLWSHPDRLTGQMYHKDLLKMPPLSNTWGLVSSATSYLVSAGDWGFYLDGPGQRSVQSVGVGNVLVDARNEAIVVSAAVIPARNLLIDEIVVAQGQLPTEIDWK